MIAVDNPKSLATASATVVNCPCNQFLASSSFSTDHNLGVNSSGLSIELEHLMHGVRFHYQPPGRSSLSSENLNISA